MATKKNAPAEGMRRCIGSERFGIKPHDSRIGDFPSQPSQKDGLGRLCKVDWARYTAALRQAAIARQAAPAVVAEVEQADADQAQAKVKKTTRAAPNAKPVPAQRPAAKAVSGRTGRPSRRAAEEGSSGEDDATVVAQAAASTPDFEAAAEQDAILVERRQRVKAWRKGELEGTAVKA